MKSSTLAKEQRINLDRNHQLLVGIVCNNQLNDHQIKQQQEQNCGVQTYTLDDHIIEFKSCMGLGFNPIMYQVKGKLSSGSSLHSSLLGLSNLLFLS
jgi:hypothetical protein